MRLRKSLDPHSAIKLITEENQILQSLLLEATDKQHQEMSRAIDLKEKNEYLRSRIHDAKIEACKLRDCNSKLQKYKHNQCGQLVNSGLPLCEKRMRN